MAKDNEFSTASSFVSFGSIPFWRIQLMARSCDVCLHASCCFDVMCRSVWDLFLQSLAMMAVPRASTKSKVCPHFLRPHSISKHMAPMMIHKNLSWFRLLQANNALSIIAVNSSSRRIQHYRQTFPHRHSHSIKFKRKIFQFSSAELWKWYMSMRWIRLASNAPVDVSVSCSRCTEFGLCQGNQGHREMKSIIWI